MNVRDSVILVTGANRGLGLAFAQAAITQGARKVYAGVRNPSGAGLDGIIEVKLDLNDPSSIVAAATQCGDTTLLINNAGIAGLNGSLLDPETMKTMREIFETNLYGTIAVAQAFAPVLARNGGGAIINVLSDATWFSRPMLAAYSASKTALWSYTNALRIELRDQKTHLLALHVSFMDTDMTHGFEMKKIVPSEVAQATLDGLEAGKEEVLADDFTSAAKLSLSTKQPFYLNPPDIA